VSDVDSSAFAAHPKLPLHIHSDVRDFTAQYEVTCSMDLQMKEIVKLPLP
jgi:hypothetical protein